MAEVVSHNNNFSQEIHEWAERTEALSDPVTRRDYFEHIEPKDFIDLVEQVSSLVRTGDSTQRQPLDGEKVRLMFHEVPDQRDKEQLLVETWETARSFLSNPDIDDDSALEYAALTAAGGLLLTHPFLDGNGRTSRVISLLISQGVKNESDLKELLSKQSSRNLSAWEISPSDGNMISGAAAYNGDQPHSIDWELQLVDDANDALGGAITSSSHESAIMRSFIEAADEHAKSILEPFIVRNSNGEPQSINANDALEALVNDSDHGIEYAAQLLGIQRRLRADSVRRFLHSMMSTQHVEPRLPRIARSSKAGVDSEQRIEHAQHLFQSRQNVHGQVLPRDNFVVDHRTHSAIHLRKLA